MSERGAPAQRDQGESPFSEILAGFWHAHPSVLAAAFVDGEGECIDYYSCLDPFEAKVAGAHLVAVLSGLAEAHQRAGLGGARVWTVEASKRDFVVARVGRDYCVVLVLQARGLTARVLEAIDGLVEAFSLEAGVPNELPGVQVVLADGGRGEPVTIRLPQGEVEVERVLARWSEPGALSAQPRRCFRVQLASNGRPPGVPSELTVVHDPHLDTYRVRRRTSTPT